MRDNEQKYHCVGCKPTTNNSMDRLAILGTQSAIGKVSTCTVGLSRSGTKGGYGLGGGITYVNWKPGRNSDMHMHGGGRGASAMLHF